MNEEVKMDLLHRVVKTIYEQKLGVLRSVENFSSASENSLSPLRRECSVLWDILTMIEDEQALVCQAGVLELL
jgi:hypothetical protein